VLVAKLIDFERSQPPVQLCGGTTFFMMRGMSINRFRVFSFAVVVSVLTIPLMVSASSSAQANGQGPFNLPIQSMMTYQFTDVANPQLATYINATNEVHLVDGSPQEELITSAYGGTSVTISIVPPSGWTLTSVVWDSGNGTYTVPADGVTITHSFTYTISQSGSASKSNGGVFKIKKAGGS
jgi:hypothetical protein